MAVDRTRHVLGISGGKDSAALAVYMKQNHPEINLEYFFCDTGCELDETYEFLDRLKARLGIKITYLSAERGFDHWLKVYKGFLPSATARWCTKQLKIIPIEKFVGDDEAISYIAIRADEDRDGYISAKDHINPRYPFREARLVKADIYRILEESGVGIPKYYEWRSRSGCYFCFFQRKIEWVGLYDNHPDLFEKAQRYETEHSDGRKFTWNDNETLSQLLDRREEIISEYNKAEERLKNRKIIRPNMSLAESLDALDEEEGFNPCSVCHL
ncbi:MAG: phosphoadenosine phosphosulfate reductase family protein [Candidatus Thorarchaeota archaeon]